MKGQRIGDKYFKQQLLINDPNTSRFVPKMKVFTDHNFWVFLNEYKKVVIKPIRGSLGKGLIFITKTEPDIYDVHSLNQRKVISGKNNVLTFIKSNVKAKSMIQHYIPLVKVKEQPLDFRLICQREKGSNEWVVTGKYARVAHADYAVTNMTKGASILTVEDALSQSNLCNDTTNDISLTLNKVAISVARCLSKQFHKQLIWGCDLAVADDGSVWIIEANSNPQTNGFNQLETLQPMLHLINQYKQRNKNFWK
ncbi:YheC/YheD family protein [Bacillus shivajii]|uniref:YheC/YheD family protein n=1 Tax=Bacillus shivajii TaxID=1983719 RepID=UPI001CFBCCBA|nr:YheC/YheD family protein [Bacillus shivajii]UCZ51934.1 YheC/YheD family protein [Bacillus shivajii]